MDKKSFMKKSFVKKTSVLFVLFSALKIFTSCQFGLGNAVDTQAPTISIEYPPVQAVIRDSFILYGNWSDDQGLSSVKVKVINTATGKTVFENSSAEINSANKTWQIKLNSYDLSNSSYYNGWEFADGTYQVSVIAKDNAEHNSGEVSRTFDIDNTAPVFIVSNPGVVKDSKSTASAYGSIFTVDGTISDDHTISSMDVVIYDSSGNIVSKETYNGEEINSFRENDIQTAGGTSVTFAQKGSANNRYALLYNQEDGTEYFTCSVKLTDSAQVYQNPADADNLRSAAQIKTDNSGNSTHSVYLYDSVYTNLMSSKKGLGLSAADLKNIINKTVENAEVLAVLQEVALNTENHDDTKNLYFSLNPKANPTYQVNGFEYDFDENKTLQQSSSGNTITITVNQGLDGTKIDLDGAENSNSSVKVWLKEYENRPSVNSQTYSKENILTEISNLATNVLNAEKDEKNFIEYSKANTENPASEFNNWKLIFDYGQNFSGESSVSTKTFSITLPNDFIVLGKYYILALTGSDVDGVSFLQDKVYGFAGNEAGVAPTIKFDSPENASLLKSSDFSFTGTAKLESGSLYVSELKASLTVFDQINNTTIGTYVQNIKRTLPNENFVPVDSSSSTEVFNCVDGNWTFTPSKLSDYEKIKAGENSGKSYVYTLELYGKSSSGHNITLSTYVQIDSNAPVVELSSITPTVNGSEYDSSDKTYVNGTISVKASVEETNLDNVSMQVFADGKLTSIFDDGNGGKTDILNLGKVYSFTKNLDTSLLSESDGKSLDIRITATDKVGNSTTYSSLTANSSSYKNLVILQETDRPKILLGNSSNSSDFTADSSKISETNGNLFGTSSNNKLTATISDDDTIALVEVTLYDKNGNLVKDEDISDVHAVNPYVISPNRSSYPLTYYLPQKEGIYKICIDAYDYNKNDSNLAQNPHASYGKGTTGTYFIAVSKGAPTISLNNVNSYQTATPKFSGTVSSSNVKLSAVFIDSETEEELKTQPASLNFTLDSQTKIWSASLKENETLSDGTYKILFKAANAFGQSGTASAGFTVDSQNPEIKITNYGASELADGLSLNVDFYVIPSNNYTVKGKVSDSVSGVDSVYFYIGDYSVKPTLNNANGWSAASISSSSGKTIWTASLTGDMLQALGDSGKTDGSVSYDFHVLSIDKAGNVSDSLDFIKIYPDSVAPQTSLKSTNLYAKDGSQISGTEDLTDGETYYAKTLDFTFSGTITENKFKSLKINGTDIYDNVSQENLTWNYSPNLSANSKDGTFSYKIELSDKAGNLAEKTVSVILDKTSPAISLTSPSLNKNVDSNVLELTGTANDFGSGLLSVSYEIFKISADSDVSGGGVSSVSAASSGATENSAVSTENFAGTTAESTVSTASSGGTGTSTVSTSSSGGTGNSSVNGASSGGGVSSVSTGNFSAETENLSANGEFSSSVNLNDEGIYEIKLSAKDILGNETIYGPITFYYDKTGPELEAEIVSNKIGDKIIDGKKYSVYASPVFSISANVKDKISKVSNVVANSSTNLTVNKGANPQTNPDESKYSGTVYAQYSTEEGKKGITLITVSASDQFGNTSTKTFADILVDVSAPVVNITSSPASAQKSQFTISGTASDDVALSSVIITDSLSSKSYETKPDENGKWTLSLTPSLEEGELNVKDGNHEFTVKATDKAGNSSQKTCQITTDVTKPVWATDSNGKTFPYISQSGKTENFSASEGKTEERIYYNQTLLNIMVKATDETSGISSFAYNLNGEKNDGEETAIWRTVGNANFTLNSFAEGANTLLVKALDSAGNESETRSLIFYIDSKIPNSAVLTYLGGTENLENNTQETGLIRKLVNGKSALEFKVKLEDDKSSDSKTYSGISSVALTKIGNENLKDAIQGVLEPEQNSSVYKITIPKEKLSSGQVQISVSDKAGNLNTFNLFNIILDTQGPDVKLSAPTYADTSKSVNKIISLQGTVSDTNEVNANSVYLEYKNADSAADSVWKRLTNVQNQNENSASSENEKFAGSSFSVSSVADSKFSVNNLDTSQFDDKSTINLRAVALDAAGNEGKSAELTLYINQDSDRPIVKINNLTRQKDGSFILKYGTNAEITGSLSDDDSGTGQIVKTFITSSSPINSAEGFTKTQNGNEISYTKSGDFTTKFNSASGDFTITPGDKTDGEKSFYIYVEDASGTTFYTSAKSSEGTLPNGTSYLANPKIYLKTEQLLDAEYAAKQITYRSDSNPPSVKKAQSYTYDSTGTINRRISGAENINNLETVDSSFIVGGTKKSKLQFVITASDENGISGMTLELSKKDSKTNQEISLAKYASSSVINDVALGETFKTFADSNASGANTSGVSGTSSFTATKDSGDAVWTTGIIDISSYETSTVNLKATAYDNSGLLGSQSYSFVVDLTAPAISISSPQSTVEVTGDTTVQGTATDSGGSTTEKLVWFIPTNAQIEEAKSKSESETQSYWRNLILPAEKSAETSANSFSERAGSSLDNKSNVSIWQFIFGSTGNSPALINFDDADFVDSSNKGLYNIPVYILAEDALGNYAVKTDYTIKHNPDGDKPRTTVTYPDADETTLGGTIRLSGTVTIPTHTVAASGVFVQIDNSASLGKTYVEGLKDSSNAQIHKVYSAAQAIKKVLKTESEIESSDFAKYGFDSEESFNSWWGIEANIGSATWTKNINSNGEFNPTNSGETNTIYLRASGINADGKIGAWTKTFTVKVDNSAPTISYGLNQFSSIEQTAKSENGSSATVNATSSASKNYTSNMFLKGKWYIVAEVLDETGIASMTVSEKGKSQTSYNIVKTTDGAKTLTIPDGYFVETINSKYTESAQQKHGFKIYIPVKTNDSETNSGSIIYTLEVGDSDATSHISKMEFVLNIDNTAPTIDFVYGNGDTLAENGSLATVNGKIYSYENRYNVQEKNYVFSPSGRVSDSGSGYERVLFQFIRGENDLKNAGSSAGALDGAVSSASSVNSSASTAGKKIILDPMIANTDSSNYFEAKIEIDGSKIKEQKIEQDGQSSEQKSYSLYGKSVQGTLSSTSKFNPQTSTEISSDKHIRKGGLIYVDGLYRVITNISDAGEVEFSPEAASFNTSQIEAFFPYAQVVDNTSTEKILSSSYSANPLELSADDGDGMLESITKVGNSWTWDATIHSTNLPDGPATLIVLAFDAAGNVSGVEIPVMIANNAPRLAKVWLGTDLDKNGKFTDSEFEEYALIENNATSGLEVATKDLENKFTAKDGLALVAEFTGGNGEIKMAYKRNSSSSDAIKSSDVSTNASGGFIQADFSAIATVLSGSGTSTASLSSAGTSRVSGVANMSSGANGASSPKSLQAQFTTYFKSSNVRAYLLSNENLTGTSTPLTEATDGKNKNFSFTFWDSTEETICGINSQNARLALKNMALDLVDATKPLVRVNPFYWASSTKNSLFKNSTANGHIELESDLPADKFNSTTTTGEFDRDPKISGKIVFTGTAYDDHALSQLTASFGNINATVTYSSASGQWTSSGTLGDANSGHNANGQSNPADSSAYKFTVYSTAPDSAYYESDTAYFNQKGHKVYWELAVDTEKAITEIAAADKMLTVKAKDLSNNETDTSSSNQQAAGNQSVNGEQGAQLSTENQNSQNADSVYNKPTYRTDVVPYITRLDTSLTDLEKRNPSVYGRTALGKYPVYYYSKTTSDSQSTNAEKIIMLGFNIKGGTVNFTNEVSQSSTSQARVAASSTVAGSTQSATTVAGPNISATLGDDCSFTLPENAKSGEIFVSVNNVSSLNNLNNNDAKGSYLGEAKDKNFGYCYNRQPNGQNNDLLTDNVELAIWELNSKAAVTQSGELSEVVMHVNPKNGMLGFAFAHSQDLASYPNGTNTSYQTWMADYTGVNQIGFIFDQNGNMFGTNGGTDTYTPNQKAGRFGLISSFWGVVTDKNDNTDIHSGYSNYHRLRLEYLGYAKNGTYASYTNRFAKGDTSQFATTVSGNSTNLYMMYYDNVLSELKFKAGQYTNPQNISWNNENSKLWNNNGNGKLQFSFGDFADDAYNNKGDGTNYNPNYQTISVLANQTNGAHGNQNAKPGIYYSIAAVPQAVDGTSSGSTSGSTGTSGAGKKDVVVAVWYDDTNKTLWYSYMADPLAKAGNRNSNDAVSTEWSTPVAILNGHAGGYCAIAVDDDNHIHIAAYSRKDAGSLYYAYLESYDAANFDEATNLVAVDAYGSSGQYITMEFAKNSAGKTVPYIGYWMNSMTYPKYAYLVNGINSLSDLKPGVDNDNMFTGAWETILLPTSSSIVLDDINIGLYKYQQDKNGHKKGELREIPKLTDESATQSQGKAGGNGTSNPIIAYGISNLGFGYIETAQLK